MNSLPKEEGGELMYVAYAHQCVHVHGCIARQCVHVHGCIAGVMLAVCSVVFAPDKFSWCRLSFQSEESVSSCRHTYVHTDTARVIM